MSALDDILAWSATESPWIRDALRRVVCAPEITDADIEELAALCKKPHGLSATDTAALPLLSTHVPANAQSGPTILESVTHVSDVNALAPNETITFSRTGLTVIYGDNGAGKSGYARILKRACRARGSGDAILANALSDKPAGAPTAKLKITVGDTSLEHVWRDGTPGPAELGTVSVFDSSSAQVYVADKTEVRFRPLGLDVLDKLAAVCARVRSRLETERDLLQRPTAAWPEIDENTEAGRLLANLTALTPREQVERIATLSDEEARELETVAEVLAVAKSENPAKKANDLRLKATRLRRLVAELRSLSDRFGSESIARIVALRQTAADAAQAAEDAGRLFGEHAELSGTGSGEWRQLWEAARTYSVRRAYPGHDFPHTDSGARCVLCQQALDLDAAKRLAGFEEFIKGNAQAAAAMAKEQLTDEERAFAETAPGERNRDALDDLSVLEPTLLEAANAFLAAVRSSRESLVSGLGQPSPVSTTPPLVELERLSQDLEMRANEIAKAADPSARKRTEERHRELAARATLANVRQYVHDEIDRRARVNAYERCVKDTDTRAITKLGTELTKKYVTDALTAAFTQELKRLGFTTLDLELRPAGGQKGVLYHQIFLKHATRAQLPKVVSEGEARCIALAAFLAEVRGATHPSAIVFDDPVSSLDHRWRTNVCRRLVEESKARQVIVFTHELVFLASILQEAAEQCVEHTSQTIARGGDHLAGHVEPGLPWTGMPVQKRINALKQEHQRAEKLHRHHGAREYDPVATRIYADLRRTWERAVEEVLLNGSVMRFRQGIETNRLKEIGDITADDLKTIQAGMTKCSKWEGGHDHAAAANEPLPGPDELSADIELIDKWVAAVRKRRN